jgi:hypothetical protein
MGRLLIDRFVEAGEGEKGRGADVIIGLDEPECVVYV